MIQAFSLLECSLEPLLWRCITLGKLSALRHSYYTGSKSLAEALGAAWLSNTVSLTGGLVAAASSSLPQDLHTCQPSVPCPGDLAMVTSSNCQDFTWTRWQAAGLAEGHFFHWLAVTAALVFSSRKRTFYSRHDNRRPQNKLQTEQWHRKKTIKLRPCVNVIFH